MSEEKRQKDLREMVEEIDEEGQKLSEWEIDFIAYLMDNDVRRFSERQEKIIRRIHEERCDA